MKLIKHALMTLAVALGSAVPALANWEAIPSAVVCANNASELNGILYAHADSVWIELRILESVDTEGAHFRTEHRKVLAPFEIVHFATARGRGECVVVRTVRR